jgi:hypothetical protein
MTSLDELIEARRARLLGNRLGTVKVAVPRASGRGTERIALPTRDLANRLARLQATPETAEQGRSLQLRFQDAIGDQELRRVGLERISGPKPGRIRGLLGATLDVLSRPSQAALRGIQGLRSDNPLNAISGFAGGLAGRGDRANLFDAIGAGSEGRRTIFGIREGSNPGKVLNLVGEAALDPVSYLTFGTGTAARQSLNATARVLGQETAEQVARRGIGILDDAQRTTLRTALGGTDEALEAFAKRARGGLRIGSSRTLIPGETVRSPLRKAGILDETRAAARRLPGGEATEEGLRRTLQTRLRTSSRVNAVRDRLQARAALRRQYGEGLANEIWTAGSRAASRAGLDTEDSIRNITARLDDLSDTLKKSGQKELHETISADMLRALDTGVDGVDVNSVIGHWSTFMDDKTLESASKLLRELEDQQLLAASKLQAAGAPTLRHIETPVAGPDAATRAARRQERLAGQFVEPEVLGDNQLFIPKTPRAGSTFEQGAMDLPGERAFNRFTTDPFPAGRNVRGQIPGQSEMFPIENIGLPRQSLEGARRSAREGGASTQGHLDDAISGKTFESAGRGNISRVNEELTTELNKVAQQQGRKKVEAALETDVTRLVGLNAVQANRQLSAVEMLDELGKVVVDPQTGQPLILTGADDVVRERATSFNYQSTEFGGQTVWAPPQMMTEIERFKSVVFSDPGAVEGFKRGYDKWLNLWKGSATVPILFGTAFHARNMTGNIFNNWLAGGIHYRHYDTAKNYQKAIILAQKRMSQQRPPPIQRALGLVDDTPTGIPIARASPTAREALGDGRAFDKFLREAAEEVGLNEKDVAKILTMRDEGVISSGFFRTDLHEDAVGSLNTAQRESYLRGVLNDPHRNILIRSGTKMGHTVETNARIAHYLGKIDQGLTPEGAMLSVKKHLFDYADLTDFERKFLRRVIPFYTFMRFNTPLQFQNMITQPRKLLNAQRAQEAIASLGGGDFSENKALSAWALNRGDVPVSGTLSQWLAGGEDPVLFGVDLPTEAAIEAIEPFVLIAAAKIPGMDRLLPEADDPRDGFRAFANLPGGAGIEFLKLMIEEALNEDLFTGAPVDQRNFLVALGEAALPLSAKANSLIADLTSQTDNLEGNRVRVRIIKNLLGLNLTVVDPRRQRAEIFRQLDVLELAIDNAKAQGIDVPTVTELRDAGLIPTIKQLNAADRNGQGPALGAGPSQIGVPPSVTGETNRLGLRQRSPA